MPEMRTKEVLNMVSPVPKHLRTDEEIAAIPANLRGHVMDLDIDASKGVKVQGTGRHRAKYAPGLASALVEIAGSKNIGDPFAGTGTLAYETGLPVALNDIDKGMSHFLDPLIDQGCTVSYGPAHKVEWSREVMIFSPPYYPRTDRRVPCAHNDEKRGPVVGFRDSYSCDHPDMIGNPGGVNAILQYREAMTRVYRALAYRSDKIIVVTKNWMRLGVELRLDLDTILMAESAGWSCVARHGYEPKQSLWSRFNEKRGEAAGTKGMVTVEDILVFERRAVEIMAAE